MGQGPAHLCSKKEGLQVRSWKAISADEQQIAAALATIGYLPTFFSAT